MYLKANNFLHTTQNSSLKYVFIVFKKTDEKYTFETISFDSKESNTADIMVKVFFIYLQLPTRRR